MTWINLRTCPACFGANFFPPNLIASGEVVVSTFDTPCSCSLVQSFLPAEQEIGSEGMKGLPPGVACPAQALCAHDWEQGDPGKPVARAYGPQLEAADKEQYRVELPPVQLQLSSVAVEKQWQDKPIGSKCMQSGLQGRRCWRSHLLIVVPELLVTEFLTPDVGSPATWQN